jgi:hypothetical protein
VTPNRYSLNELKKLIPKISGNLKLYHWTNQNALLEILKCGKIYSKGTLWGLDNNFKCKNKTVTSDAKNGFIDYVFLGTTPWPKIAPYSAYGHYGLELSLEILNEREFFVFNKNTGVHWNQLRTSEKFSDLSTLLSILANNIKTSEFLVRRKVDITNGNLVKIFCPSDKLNETCEYIGNPDLKKKIEGYTPMQTEAKQFLELNYPDFTDGLERIAANRYLIENTTCYIFHPETTCVLSLKIVNGKLVDTSNNKEVGRLL